ncbi:MAG: serine/threonine protein kinase, partial [Chloroflexi bacterium]
MSAGLILAQRYRIEEEIGQGGMGSVYRAVDTQTEQFVAVKQLKPELTQNFPDVVERFIREGEALRRLNHPNIVKILDSVEQENTHWLIMEYVGGGSLRDLMDETPQLAVDRVLEIALDLSDALTRAHRLNIIHRDIKPANVLLATDGTPRLTDFGVAHFEDRTRVTSTGMVVGTFAYLSPEACRGEDLDPRTDIWSFGVMLYEMLAGKNPFERDSTAALLTAIVMEEPQPLVELRPDIPPALTALVHAMLVKERDKRIQSIRQVGAALEEILSKGHEATFTAHTSTLPVGQVVIDDSETVLAQTPDTPYQVT